MAGYATDLTLKIKVLPLNSRNALPIASAPEAQITTSSRAWKPYPPGNVKLNGYSYDAWPAATSGDVTLTWSHRSRREQGAGGQLVAQDTAGSYTLEGTLKLEVLIAGTVKRTWTGLTGTSQVYTAAQRAADDADETKSVQFRITPVNGTLNGNARTTPAFVMSA